MPTTPGRPTHLAGPTATLVAGAAVLLALVLVVYAAEGPRGTDQYWYIADVQTLAAGREPLSNTWFPMGLLRAEADATTYSAPFYHNGPLLHLAAALERRLPIGTYAIWLTINALCLLITVWVVWQWLRRRVGLEVAGWTAAFAAIAPVTYWQIANVLRETWFGALSASAIALFFFVPPRRRVLAEPALAFTLALGALAHPMFLILLVLLIGVRAYQWLRRRSAARLATILPGLIAVLVVRSVAERWFPSSFQPDLTSIIVSAIPRGTNMAWHFSDVQATLDARFLTTKLVEALRQQFVRPSSALIYLPVNAALLAWVALMIVAAQRAWRERTGPAPSGHSAIDDPQTRAIDTDQRGVPPLFTLMVLGTFLGLYTAIVWLQQNHMRFQQLIAPASFILIGHAMHAFVPRRALVWLMTPLLVVCLIVSTLMARQLLAESVTEARDRDAVAAALPELGAQDRVLFVDHKRHDPLSFLLRPTPALFIRSSLISDASAREAIARFDPSVLVTREPALPYGLEGFERTRTLHTDSFDTLVVWQPEG